MIQTEITINEKPERAGTETNIIQNTLDPNIGKPLSRKYTYAPNENKLAKIRNKNKMEHNARTISANIIESYGLFSGEQHLTRKYARLEYSI